MAKDDFDIVAETKISPKVEVAAKVEKPSKSDVLVTLDMAFAEVLKYDSEGRMVRFACEPGKFLRLTDEQIDRLAEFTRGAYLDAARTHTRALEEAAHPSFIKEPISQGGTATARLEVRNKEPGMFYSWRRPDEYRQVTAYEGYQVVNDDELDTFTRSASTVRTVGAHGDPELILVKIPEATKLERLKADEAASQQRNKAAQAAGAAELRQAGGQVYDPDENPQVDAKRNWRDRMPGDNEGR